MNRKRKAQKEAAEYARKLHHELGSWRDTTKERCYTYCRNCGGILTIHIETQERYVFEKQKPDPDDPEPTITARWNNGARVQDYVCPVGKAASDRAERRNKRDDQSPREVLGIGD